MAEKKDQVSKRKGWKKRRKTERMKTTIKITKIERRQRNRSVGDNNRYRIKTRTKRRTFSITEHMLINLTFIRGVSTLKNYDYKKILNIYNSMNISILN